MELTNDDVLQIVELLNESSFDELRLEMGNLRLLVGRGNRGGILQEREFDHSTVDDSESPVGLSPPPTTQGNSANACVVSESAASGEVVAAEDQGLVAIKAMSVGTFYRAPKPESPPYVEVGSFVKEDTIVCVIEVMKCYLTVRAETMGFITKICAENAKMVEYGQSLFLVKPAESDEEGVAL